MALLNFRKRDRRPARRRRAALAACWAATSIEVMPRTAEKVEDFRALLPEGTRVYIAHIDGTPIEDMVATAASAGAKTATIPCRISPPASSRTPPRWRLDRRYQGEAGRRPGAAAGRRRGGSRTARSIPRCS